MTSKGPKFDFNATLNSGLRELTGPGIQSERNYSNIQNNTQIESLFNKNNIISLDKNCLSCAQSTNTVIKAFKMACLSYTPNLVSYKDKKYSREDLLLLRTQKIVRLLAQITPIQTNHYIIDTQARCKLDDKVDKNNKSGNKKMVTLIDLMSLKVLTYN